MHTVIITAGGTGKRMGANIPKQFLLLNGKPVLQHTLERFHSYDPSIQLIVTLPSEWQSHWKNLCSEHACTIPHALVEGGTERYHSIRNALQVASGELIAVHDGVRPLVSHSTIRQCMEAAQHHGAAIPVLPVTESLRSCSDSGSHAVDRAQFRIVQTPQCFQRKILIGAYERPYHSGITDDASLVEESGTAIHLVQGNRENIKITDPADLAIAELFIQHFGDTEVV